LRATGARSDRSHGAACAVGAFLRGHDDNCLRRRLAASSPQASGAATAAAATGLGHRQRGKSTSRNLWCSSTT